MRRRIREEPATFPPAKTPPSKPAPPRAPGGVSEPPPRVDVSETCTCGARFQMAGPAAEVATWLQTWRDNHHRHSTPEKPSESTATDASPDPGSVTTTSHSVSRGHSRANRTQPFGFVIGVDTDRVAMAEITSKEAE